VRNIHIVFTVTNELSFDQRMARICTVLANAGYAVTLIGRERPNAPELEQKGYAQLRLRCFFNKGVAFYAEYNLRLFAYLLFARYDVVCSIDLDTLAAGAFSTLIRRKKRVFDAHEYFTEVPELVNRPFVRSVWAAIARVFLPFYTHAYTVSPGLSEIFSKKYGINFTVVRNVNLKIPLQAKRASKKRKILLYQGALNEGRGIAELIAALPLVPETTLWIAGEGDLSTQLRELVVEADLQDRVVFFGMLKPSQLLEKTAAADIGLNLLENRGLSYYYSLANKFFDFVQAEIPALNMDFPEYRFLNKEYEVSILLSSLAPEEIAAALCAVATELPQCQRSLELGVGISKNLGNLSSLMSVNAKSRSALKHCGL
jgi:glycosyltransferase involved in cell wall biosynthesis